MTQTPEDAGRGPVSGSPPATSAFAAPHTRKRSDAFWAAVAAGLMFYYGYFTAPYAGEPLLGMTLFDYTLKIGCFAMALAAVVLASGSVYGLLVDGVCALLIGGAFLISGMLLITRHLTSPTVLAMLLFGYIFFTSGWRSFRLFVAAGQACPPSPADGPERPG